MSSISEFTNSKNPSYGFIGLGTMGWEMARNLRSKLPAESTLHVCEINQIRCDAFLASTPGNVRALSSPKEVGKYSNIIFTMLPRGEHVLEVFTNSESGLLADTYQDSRIFVECSTIDVRTCETVANLVSQNKAGAFVDAPVSGGQRGARAATLTFMVGGTESVFDLIAPVLEMMGKNLFHCGKIGSGLATKQINNYLSAANMIAVCEGMQLGRLYGLDLKTLAGVINTSTGMSRNSREQNPVKGISSESSAANDFEGGFSTELCQGVVMMSLQLSKQLKAKSVLGEAVGNFYSDAIQSELCQGLDFRSIYRLFQDQDNM